MEFNSEGMKSLFDDLQDVCEKYENLRPGEIAFTVASLLYLKFGNDKESFISLVSKILDHNEKTRKIIENE